MKSLYDETEYLFTPEGTECENECYNQLKTIMDKYRKKGYSPREISHIMIDVAINLECVMILDINTSKLV